jgi:hypothetical protein
VILALHDLNTAVEGRDLKVMLRALQYPGLKVAEYVCSTDAELYCKHLHVCISQLHNLSNIIVTG